MPQQQAIADVTKPLWDQRTFYGRLRHFAWLTDPRSLLATRSELSASRQLVLACRSGAVDPRTVPQDQLARAKQLNDSAFHPDTGDLQNVLGRMSCQVPAGMALTGALLAFYRTTGQVVFWQWVNQSFNALVNYTNRNAESGASPGQLFVAYASATTSAVTVAIGLKRFLANRAPPVAHRLVPFAAVAAANMVNLPLMRQAEIRQGVRLRTAAGEQVATSQLAAAKGITQVVTSRITMAAPGMLLTPFIMERIELLRWFQRYKRYVDAPIQTLIVGCFLIFMVPAACALFPQSCSVTVGQLKTFDSAEYQRLKQLGYGDDTPLYFNKGL